MRLEFEDPLTPNFIRTKQGVFSLKEISPVELEIFINLWTKDLREKHTNAFISKKEN